MDIDNNYVKTQDIQGFKEDETTTKEMRTNINMVAIIIVKVPNISLL